MTRNTNPFAFPFVFSNPEISYYEGGMTLRDYFAGQALPAVVNACQHDTRADGEAIPQLFARKSYELADAMLTERLK